MLGIVKLTFLGSGSAFTVGSDNFQSNMLLESDSGAKLLIDCGTDIRFSLHKLGYSYTDITDVYITHLHADHVGGLEWLGFGTHFHSNCGRPNLYLSHTMVHDLWHRSLVGGMRSVQSVVTDLDFFFNVHPIHENHIFSWEDINFHLIQTVHALNGFSLMPSYGLIFNINDQTILISADTQFCPALMAKFYKNADLIFHDCEISQRHSGVHARYQDLLTLDKSIREKMWLYHYEPLKLPDTKKAGFRGFVKRGQCFNL